MTHNRLFSRVLKESVLKLHEITRRVRLWLLKMSSFWILKQSEFASFVDCQMLKACVKTVNLSQAFDTVSFDCYLETKYIFSLTSVFVSAYIF